MKGGSGESAHQLKYLADLRRSCVVRCVILGGEHAQLCGAHDFEGTGRSEHQLADLLATVKMHTTEFIELSLLLMLHSQHTDPSTNAAMAPREEASCEYIRGHRKACCCLMDQSCRQRDCLQPFFGRP